MKRFLALLLSFLLSFQGVLAVPANEVLAYEDGDDNISQNTEKEQAEDLDNKDNTEDTDNTQAETNAQAENTGEGESQENTGTNISAPSAVLMEASTGQVIFEKDADKEMPPASVTKVMTLLLIFDALNAGKIKLEDQVSVSEFAASIGGSQVFLEPGETQTVDTMIKCISIASANDACEPY